jgi:hypothetical protein
MDFYCHGGCPPSFDLTDAFFDYTTSQSTGALDASSHRQNGFSPVFLTKPYNLLMTYSEAKGSLTSILEWLEKDDDAGWEGQIDVGEQCRSEMERMARPNYKRGNRVSGTPDHNPNLNRAIPHVRAMLASVRSRNRAAAVEHGKAAVAVM